MAHVGFVVPPSHRGEPPASPRRRGARSSRCSAARPREPGQFGAIQAVASSLGVELPPIDTPLVFSLNGGVKPSDAPTPKYIIAQARQGELDECRLRDGALLHLARSNLRRPPREQK